MHTGGAQQLLLPRTVSAESAKHWYVQAVTLSSTGSTESHRVGVMVTVFVVPGETGNATLQCCPDHVLSLWIRAASQLCYDRFGIPVRRLVPCSIQTTCVGPERTTASRRDSRGEYHLRSAHERFGVGDNSGLRSLACCNLY